MPTSFKDVLLILIANMLTAVFAVVLGYKVQKHPEYMRPITIHRTFALCAVVVSTGVLSLVTPALLPMILPVVLVYRSPRVVIAHGGYMLAAQLLLFGVDDIARSVSAPAVLLTLALLGAWVARPLTHSTRLMVRLLPAFWLVMGVAGIVDLAMGYLMMSHFPYAQGPAYLWPVQRMLLDGSMLLGVVPMVMMATGYTTAWLRDGMELLRMTWVGYVCAFGLMVVVAHATQSYQHVSWYLLVLMGGASVIGYRRHRVFA